MDNMPFTQRIQALAGILPGAGDPLAPEQPLAGLNKGSIPSYKQGGLVGSGGDPVRPATQPQMMDPKMLEAQVQQTASANPQMVAQLRQAIEQAINSGELTIEELAQAVHLAKLAIANPGMYPQIRQFAIKQGIGDEQTIPQQYDQGLLFVLLVAGQAVQDMLGPNGSPSGQGMPQQQQPMSMPQGGNSMANAPSMKTGGALPQRSPNKDGSINIKAHEGEFVIPAHIVRAKGTEFFEKMIEQYDPNNPKK